MPAANLAHFIEQNADVEEIDLMEIPAMRRDLTETSIRASLQDALEQLDQSGKQALYVSRGKKSGAKKIYGVLTRVEIERAYRA